MAVKKDGDADAAAEKVKTFLQGYINQIDEGVDSKKVVEDLRSKLLKKEAVSDSGHPVEERCPETCEAIRTFFNECYQLFLVKQNDRGPLNISEFGRKGIVLRICDKYSRIKRIIWDEVVPEVSEPVENEYADLAVYSAIDYTLSKDKWGK
jgi:hypothetical protein